MTYSNWLATLGIGTMTALSACAPAPEPAPGVIYAEPVFDKFGNPSCRPGDVPIGGAYTVDLPLCPTVGTVPVTVPVVDAQVDDSTGEIVVIDDSDDDLDDLGDDPTGRNQVQNRTNNQSRTNNQNQGE